MPAVVIVASRKARSVGALPAARGEGCCDDPLVASARRELVHVPAGPARDALDAAAMAIVHRDF